MKRLFINLSSFIALTTACLLISGCNGSGNNNNDTPPTPSGDGIIFGNEQGYLYKNYDILVGESTVNYLSKETQIRLLTTDSDNNLYVTTNELSSDAGVIWKKSSNNPQWTLLAGSQANNSLDGSTIQSITTDNKNNVYAATTNGRVFTYLNDLNIWTNIGLIIGVGNNGYILLASSESVIYAATSEGDFWSYKNNMWTIESHIPTLFAVNPTAMISTSDGIFVSYQNNRIYQYKNGSFNLYKLPISYNRISSLAYNEETHQLYASAIYNDGIDTSPQVIKINPGSEPNELIGTLEIEMPINSMIIKNNTIFIGVTDANVYFFNTSTNSWEQYGNTIEQANYFSPAYIINNHQNKLYTTAIDNETYGNVYELNNDSQQWQAVGSGTLNSQPITALLQLDNDLYISTIGGQTYKYNEQNKNLIALTTNNAVSEITSLAMQNNTLYAGANNSNIYTYNNQTESWNIFQKLYDQENRYETTLYNHKNTFYATISSKYDNIGTVWRFESTTNQMKILSGQANESSLDNSIILSLVVDSNNNIYVGTGLGQVWKLTSESNIWTKVGGGYIDYSAITALSLNTNNQLYAGTANGLIFKLDSALNNWIPSSVYLDGSPIMSLVTDGVGNQFAVTEFGNIFFNSDDSWINIHMGNGAWIRYTQATLGIQ